MVIASLSQTCRHLHHWWRRPSHRKTRSERRRRPPTLETLETRMVPAGTWTPLVHAPLDQIATMMLLSDGTVLAQGDSVDTGGPFGASQKWYKLTPDASGSYVDGTWTSVAQMHLARLYYGSNILPDGRVFIVGGEYSGNRSQQNFTNTGEIYDPVANTWTNIAPFPRTMFGDDPTQVLPDGRVLAGYLLGGQTYIYNPATNTWTATGSKLRGDMSDEESWIKLPDGSILSYDIFSPPTMMLYHAQRYNPVSNTWVDAGNVPVPLSSSVGGDELGPGFLLPDGRVFQLGAGYLDPMSLAFYANTAFYNPATNAWTAGPVIPNQLAAEDAPGAMMPNGHVLFAADHVLPTIFTGPTEIFEFDPTTNPPSITDVTPSSSVLDLSGPVFPTRMLVLPSGQVLMTNGYRQLAIYTPMGNPTNAWRPTISDITSDGHGHYTLTGTQLNGISEGAAYGDDAEMSSNYPIVRLTASNGRVYYGRTYNWSSTGVATASTPVTTQFTLPATLPEGTYNLAVVANGIASNPTPFTYSLATHFSVTASVSSLVAGNAFTVTVRALDASNQTVPTYRGTVHFTSDDAQASVPANYTFTAADNGVHTFSNVVLRTVGLHQVVATDITISSTTGRALVTVNPAGVNHLFVSTSAADPQLAATPFDVTVTAQDAYNNTVTAYTSMVRFASTDPHATLPPIYAFTANDRGVHTFHNGATLQTPCSQTIMATGVSDGINGATVVNVVTSPNATHFLVTTTATNPQVAGLPFNVTVAALNMCNNGVINYTGMIAFSSSDSQATLPPNYTFTAADNGVHTFVRGATLKTAGSQTITAMGTADGISGLATINVMAAAASHFVVTTTASDPDVTGTPFSVTVTAQDAFNNTATTYGGTIHFTSSDPRATLPRNYTFLSSDAGVHTFVLGATLRTAGSQSVNVRDTSANITGTATVNVTTAHFLVTVTAANPQVAGVPFDVTVTAQDPLNHTLTDYAGTVAFTSGDPQAALPANYTFTTADAGVHTFAAGATLFTAGTWNVTVTGVTDGVTGAALVNVTAAAADHFIVFTSAADPQVAGVPFDVTVLAQDAFNNTATTYTGTVHFSSGDPQAALPPDYTFTATDAGVHTFAAGAALFTAGTWDVTAADVSSGINSTTTVNVIAAPAVAFQVTAPATVTSGTPFDVTVVAMDPYGNIDTNYQGGVTFSTSDQDPGVVLPVNYVFTATDAGVHTFTDTGLGETTLITSGDQTITVTDTADNTITGTTTVTVMPGPLTSGRRNLIRLAVALTPAASRQTLVPDSATAASLERAGVDRFFTAAGSDQAWAVPGLKPPAGLHVLPKPHDGDGSGEAFGAELALDQIVL